MSLGHSIGLSDAYYRPTVEQCLSEYLKVVGDLTIDPANRLTKQVQELKQKEHDQNYIIKGKQHEQQEEIDLLKSQVRMMMNTMDKLVTVTEGEKQTKKKLLARDFINNGMCIPK